MVKENGHLPTRPQSDRCLACGGRDLALVEAVPIARIAELWALDRADGSDRPADIAAWLTAVRNALGVEVVRFDRCQACGLEMSTPRLAWAEGFYPTDENYPVR